MPIESARPRKSGGTRKYAIRSEKRKTLSSESDRSIRYTVVHSPAGPSASAIPAATASAKSSPHDRLAPAGCALRREEAQLEAERDRDDDGGGKREHDLHQRS